MMRQETRHGNLLSQGGRVRSKGIFLVRDGQLVVLNEQPYQTEDVFQQALARFPDVLAGGSTAADGEVRRLVLVTREMGVPSSEGGSATWSLDHLFIDEAGVPVFVEVKRSSDTRIRREVIGQMLDYAANAVAYWPVADLQRSLEASDEARGRAADEILRDAFGDVDVDQYWRTVEQNLRDGNVRLVFVADRLPPELVRIIEFLNERMSPTEVLGVEVMQYVGEGHQLFVPELVGRTARAVTTKRRTQGRQWDEESFLTATRERHGEEVAALFQRMFDHLRAHEGRFSWGRGVSPGVAGWYPIDGDEMPLWTANAGVHADSNGAPTGSPSLYTSPAEVAKRLPSERFEMFITALEGIVSYQQKLREAKAVGWRDKYPTLMLAGIAKSKVDQEKFFSALNTALERD